MLELEKRGKLLRNYTQNIDGLETMVGIKNVIQCHGSFEYCYCLVCNKRMKGDEIKEEIFKKQVPICKYCPKDEENPAIIKPCITFFHEKLPQTFDDAIEKDVKECDLVIVMGSSLKVAPVAELIHLVDSKTPQILINRETLGHLESHFDIHLLGDSDVVVEELCHRLDWHFADELFKTKENQFKEPHHFIFENGRMDVDSAGEPSASEKDMNSSAADEESVEEDELAGLFKDAEDMDKIESPTRIKFKREAKEEELTSESDTEFNPYKKAKVNS